MRFTIIITLIAGVFAFQNCAKTSFSGSSLDGGAVINAADVSVDSTPPVTNDGPVVCDPLGGGGTASNENGLVGNLYYVPAAMQTGSIKTLDDVQAKAVKASGTIYMTQMNVPTTNFEQGFATVGGGFLKDEAGNKLIEYFGLHMNTELGLTEADADGYYQLATVSDDGFVVAAKLNGMTALLAGKYDEVHQTRSDCGEIAVPLKKGDRLPIELFYYQGPRAQIAATLLWRKVADPTKLNAKGCNVMSLTDFFVDRDDGKGPMQVMAAQGWKVVPTANFWLPKSAGANPCAK